MISLVLVKYCKDTAKCVYIFYHNCVYIFFSAFKTFTFHLEFLCFLVQLCILLHNHCISSYEMKMIWDDKKNCIVSEHKVSLKNPKLLPVNRFRCPFPTSIYCLWRQCFSSYGHRYFCGNRSSVQLMTPSNDSTEFSPIFLPFLSLEQLGLNFKE